MLVDELVDALEDLFVFDVFFYVSLGQVSAAIS